MKKLYIILTAGLLCGVVYAAQDTAISNREVRDPKRLEVWLEANASDTETRVASLEGGSTVGSVEPGYVIVGNASTVGVDVAVSGDITMATNGAVAIASGVIVNADVNASAAIVGSKLDLTSGTGAITLGAGDDLTLNATGEAVLAGDATLGGYWERTPLTINPTATYTGAMSRARYTIDGLAVPAIAFVVDAPGAGAEGQVVTLMNTSTSVVTFTRSASLGLGAATRALDQYDVIVLEALDASVWLETGYTANTL